MSGRRGRRDNGLDAPLWHPLRDVDPRVGEHLLDVLRDEGIAAYLAPSTDDGPYTRTQFLPSPPTDRLFVDRARRVDARTLVDSHADDHEPAAPTPRPTPRRRRTDRAEDDAATDAEFARIVAAWHAAEAAGPRPDADHDTHGATASAEAEPRPADASTAEPVDRAPLDREPLDLEPPAPAETPILDRPDEHFEPPAPPPIPVLAPASLYALLLIAAGAVCIIAPGAIGLGLDLGIVLGVLAVVGGVGVLVSRMRDRSDDDGDGAVV
jgi:hypothetical protein